MHISYSDHTRTRHQSLSIMVNHTKGSSSPENKKKTSKVSHHTHGSLFAKKREKDDKSKSIDDGQVSMFTLADDQSILMA